MILNDNKKIVYNIFNAITLHDTRSKRMQYKTRLMYCLDAAKSYGFVQCRPTTAIRTPVPPKTEQRQDWMAAGSLGFRAETGTSVKFTFRFFASNSFTTHFEIFGYIYI